jgi:hypothetical protein
VTLDLRARMAAAGLRPSSWGNGPHDRYAEHRHDYDKVLVAEAGSIVFLVPTGAVELRAGDRLDLPSGTRHSAEVGPDGVTCLEAHLPSGSLGTQPRLTAGWGFSPAGADPAGPAEGEGGPAAVTDDR